MPTAQVKNDIEIQDEIRPQPGPQELFLSTEADIAIYGGSAFSGKTYGLLLMPLHHTHDPRFNCVIFRREIPEITKPGGMWDESKTLYPSLEAIPRENHFDWTFPSGAKILFSHLQHENDKFTWKGSQIALILFDQLETFTEGQFWYMQSRNRSKSSVKPYIRATVNPDPDSFVAKLIEWWIDQETGFAIPERSGKIRYLFREGEELIWSSTRIEALKKYQRYHPGENGKDSILSLTFIRGTIEDNKIGMKADPTYITKLRSLPLIDRMRLLEGNWKIRPAAGAFFKKSYFPIVKAIPSTTKLRIRFWDRAATKQKKGNDPDWTVGLKMSCTIHDDLFSFLIEDIIRLKGSPSEVEKTITTTASQDGDSVFIGLYQGPGDDGKAMISYYSRLLAGRRIIVYPETPGNTKIVKASPFSAQAEQGNVSLLEGPWNDEFLTEAENFPEGKHDDQIDSGSGAMKFLTSYREWKSGAY